MASVSVVDWKCAGCGRSIGATKGSARAPKGWKRVGDSLLCRSCWTGRYILRAIVIPIAAPVAIGWEEFRPLIHAMWAITTQCSNWMMTELYARDVRRLDQTQLPPMERVYLYPEARRRFPGLPAQTVSALEQSVKAKYMKRRKDVIWTCSASLPTFRYPTPFPVHNQSWSVSMEAGAPIVSMRIGDTRAAVKLQSGPRFRRQAASIALMLSGEAVRGELAIYRQGRDLMCKMVAWLPRAGNAAAREGTLTVRTMPDSMVAAFNLKDERIWVYNGDQVLRWIAEHRTRLERWSQDSKAEYRPDPPFAERRRSDADRHRRRMRTLCHDVAAMIVKYAGRRRFKSVLYDDSDHSFATEFPWFDLALKIKEKADAAGLEFIHTATAAPTETEQ